jgi:hypothetical protein
VVLGAILPTDDESRADQLALDRVLRGRPDRPRGRRRRPVRPDALERWLTGVVARAVEEGQVAAAADPRIEVVSLLAMTNGRVSSVLGQQRSVDDALAVVHYRLDRLFGPP